MNVTMTKLRKRQGALVLALMSATALGAYGITRAHAQDTSALDASAAVQKSFHPVPDFTGLVREVAPAVVSIDVHLRVDNTADDSNQGDSQDGGDQSQNGPQSLPFPFPFPFPQMQQPQAVEAKGSGFIINPDGIIVTNNHVVKDAKTVTVQLQNGMTYPAKVLGTDPRTDLAVVKISAGKPLPYVELGNSDNVTPGQWVVALGNPFGLGGTVTAGIVSALGRDIGDGPYDKFIQIDAPINEGNSGGPLFNEEGQVIGVNTAILSPSGGSVGIGFAIPSNMVKRVVTQLVSTGKVVRGYLGVEAQGITPPMAQAMGLDAADASKAGALVAAVSPDSPAAHAGLQPGDVITKVNGTTVTDPQDLADDIANIAPGGSASVDYLRGGKDHTANITVATLPSNPDQQFRMNGGTSGNPAGKGSLGLALAPITPQERQQFNLPEQLQGAIIAAVRPNSPADQAGLQPGDVVVGVGTHTVANPDDAVAAIRAAQHNGAKAIALRVIHQGQAIFVAIGLKPSAEDKG
jgi:serine protease Do